MDINKLCCSVRDIFLSGIKAVQPNVIFRDKRCVEILTSDKDVFIKVNADNTIDNLVIPMSKSKKCHLVGFGKGVLSMAIEMQIVLDGYLGNILLSVPEGTEARFKSDFTRLKNINNVQIFEGARNNLPDAKSQYAAIRIRDFVKTLSRNDVLFVLITGGGSALLPIPKEPITLEEKCTVIRNLSSSGASIDEINKFRVCVSDIKGGKLARYATNNGVIVIGLIISDIVNDPLELIASGATVFQRDLRADALGILEKYGQLTQLPTSINSVLKGNRQEKTISPQLNSNLVYNFIVANNQIAISAAIKQANQLNFSTIFLSKEIQGNVEELSIAFFQLAKAIKALKIKKINVSDFIDRMVHLKEILKMTDDTCTEIVKLIEQNQENKSICLISGGEPTVNVKGNGVGGRNQELALRFSNLCVHENDMHDDVLMLSGGTDGIDGPTDAAGAIGCFNVIKSYRKYTNSTKSIEEYLENNDSYSFYCKYAKDFHIITGHTGTNVMDLQILLIS